ncbi:class I SAM-dependent methyltransferase [Bacillus sp. 1P06AnD]|uniref:class I SAM-dependent methyltransferase n=1 Tax=Bacillus sp. 1P06AnD TaxID=3132208 RepID=UPI0039A1AD6E
MNCEEYNDPILYDKENEGYMPEMPLLLKWAEKEEEGAIIDLACGTGRMTLPMASLGYRIIGVDRHKTMLEAAKSKAEEAGLAIEWVRQDCTSLHLTAPSHFMYSVGNSFQHFLTNDDQDELLKSVNRHLYMNGTFIFDTRFPSREELMQPPTEEYWKSYTDAGMTVDVYTVSEYDDLEQIQHYITIRKYCDAAGMILRESRTSIKLRYTYPKEMERLLKNHGFEIVHVYNGWNESALSNDCYQMVYVCRKTHTIE